MNVSHSAVVVGQALRLPFMGRDGAKIRRSQTAAPANACAAILTVILCSFFGAAQAADKKPAPPGLAQVPTWSENDLNFFLHGSMGTEVVPEAVLRAFIKIYPDLFPTKDFSHLGLIADPEFGWPIGFSRTNVKHLGEMPAVGINCASCHFVQITSRSAPDPIRVLGSTSHFDVESFFGSVLIATFKTADPANMKKFLAEYLGSATPVRYDEEWREQQTEIFSVMQSDPFGASGVAPGELHQITKDDVRLHPDEAHGSLATLVHSMLRVFHNMRAALHVPDKPPEKVPPASGPGRNDAFGLLAASLLQMPQPYSPIKFGLVWNIDKRTWVHWDGNTRSPIARNLLASLGLGAPMHAKHGELEFALVKRQTDLSERIQPPRYPFKINGDAAKRGEPLFMTNCNSCHGGPESDKRLYSVAEIGTDPHRAEMFTQKLADNFNKFLAELETEGYEPPKEFGVRSTGKYWAATLNGVWARSPYLHNGSVRTMQELLRRPGERSKSFHRGSHVYDEVALGYTDEGAYVLDTSGSGNSNSGHDYGTNLSAEQKRDLIEYLKTL